MSIALPITLASNKVVSDKTLHFDYTGSDIVLRSCDAHNFRVPKLYIVNTSPVLRELIQNVSNTSDPLNSEERDPLPVVKLRESKRILYCLFTFIFPVTSIFPSTTEKIMELPGVETGSSFSRNRGTRKNPATFSC